MTFAPKKKPSRSRARTRTTAWRKQAAKKLLNRTHIMHDAGGNAIGLSHMTTKSGDYAGRKVIKKKTGKKVNKLRA